MSEPVAYIPNDALDKLNPPMIRLLGVPLITYHGENHTPLYIHPDPRVAELEAVLRECREALLHCEGVFDEVRGYPITYDLTIEAIAKIDEVLPKPLG